MNKELINWDDFEKIEIRTGTIIKAELFEKAKKPAYKIVIDFGEFGTKKTSAQITSLYNLEDIIGLQIVAVINFPPKQIADFMSECLILGALGENSEVTLLTTERTIKNGLKIG